MYSLCDQSAITDRQLWSWFLKFRSYNTSLRNEHRAGRSLDIDQEAIRNLVEFSLSKSTRKLKLDQNTSTICHHFEKIRNVSMKIF